MEFSKVMIQGSSIGGVYPLVFFDGVTEIELGNVVVSPAMNFKKFQSIVSEKIGISPHQITIYFEKHSPPPPPLLSMKSHRKIPVTSKTNFGSILNEPNCFFRAVLKRSRRARRRRPPNQSIPVVGGEEDYHGYSVNSGNLSPGNFVLLPRNTNWYPLWDHLDYANRMRILDREQTRYLNLNTGVDSDPSLNYDKHSNVMESYDGNSASFIGCRDGVICEFCEGENATTEDDETVAFHWCKYDPVTVGFRSAAGPIARPTRVPPTREGKD
ncbi:hypothetical protein Dimus_006940 [Dionaea muscipula]